MYAKNLIQKTNNVRNEISITSGRYLLACAAGLCCCKSQSPEGSCSLCSKFRPGNFHATGTSRQERKKEEMKKKRSVRSSLNKQILFTNKRKNIINGSNHQVIYPWGKLSPQRGTKTNKLFFRNPDQNERNPNQREKD